MIKLIAFDVDGTLLAPGQRKPSKRVVEAIAYAKKEGIRISLCTGRSIEEAGELIEVLSLETRPHVLGGGSTILLPGGDLLPNQVFTRSELRHIKSIVKGREDGAHYYVGVTWKNEIPEQDEDQVGIVSLLAKTHTEAFEIRTALAPLEGRFSLGIASDSHDPNAAHIHISPSNNNKGSGLKKVMELEGLQPTECAAVGDMSNDIPMFEVVSFAIAVGNAPDFVKSKATHEVASVDKDGAAEAIELLMKL